MAIFLFVIGLVFLIIGPEVFGEPPNNAPPQGAIPLCIMAADRHDAFTCTCELE